MVRQYFKFASGATLLTSRSGNGLVSYYLNLVLNGVGIKNADQQLIFNGVLQVYNLGTATLGSLLVDRVGRRKLWLTSVGGMVSDCSTCVSPSLPSCSIHAPSPFLLSLQEARY
jgi:MFS family permease